MHGICEKCKVNNGFLARLLGGVTTILCPECTTEWHALIRNHESARKIGWANAVMQNAVYRNELHIADMDYVYYQAQSFLSEHSSIMFDVALEWLGRKQCQE